MVQVHAPVEVRPQELRPPLGVQTALAQEPWQVEVARDVRHRRPDGRGALGALGGGHVLGEEVDRDVRRLGVRGGIEAGGHRDMMARETSASGAPDKVGRKTKRRTVRRTLC